MHNIIMVFICSLNKKYVPLHSLMANIYTETIFSNNKYLLKMKKTFMFMKTLLVAAGLLVGQSVWADETVVYGRAVTADLENGYTAWSAADITANAWVAASGTVSIDSENRGLKVAQQRGSARATNSSQISITDGAIVTIDAVWNTGYASGGNGENNAITIGNNIEIRAYTYDQSGKIYINGSEYASITNACGKNNGNREHDPWTIHIVINTATNKITEFTILGTNGTNKATYSLEGDILLANNTTYNSITLAHNRTKGNNAAEACYLTSILVKEEVQTVTNVDYTINYNFSGETIKTEEGNSAVGTVIAATLPIVVDNQRYYAADGATTSIELVNGTNVLNVNLREAYVYSYTINNNFGLNIASGTYTEGNDAIPVYWPKFVQNEGIWYQCDETSYGMSITGELEKTINYTTATGLNHFYEVEDMTKSRDWATSQSGTFCSNGREVGFYSSANCYATSIVDGGIYTVNLVGHSRRSGTTTFDIAYRTSNGSIVRTGKQFVYTNTGTEKIDLTVENVEIPAGCNFALINANNSNSVSYKDYITLTKTADIYSIIGLNGEWATDVKLVQDELDENVYSVTVENFMAKAGINYEYKVRKNLSWNGFQIPATGLGNKSFSVNEDGKYTLVFTANISTGAVTVDATRTADYANVVTLVNVAGWNKDNVYAYAWTGEEKNADWPGMTIEKVGTFQGYDAFAYSYESAFENIIFNNNDSKTDDLTLTDGEQYANGTIQPYYTVTYTNPDNWANVYAYTWTTKGGSDKNANWPGVAMTETEDGFVYGVHADVAPTKIIFNNNASQTDNLMFCDGLTYNFGAKGSTVAITISDAGYATYASAATLNFAESGITAYRAVESEGNEGNVSFTEQSWVPAGTGLLLKAEPGTYNVPTATSEDEDYYVESVLVGVLKRTKIEDTGIFVLMDGDQGVGFYKTTKAFTVGANTAYIPADVVTSTRSFIGFDAETITSISNVNVNLNDNMVYNLRGQRVAQPTKGLYIVNGKKVVIK